MAHAFRLLGNDHELWLSRLASTGYRLHVGDSSMPASLIARGQHLHDLTVNDVISSVFVAVRGDDVHVHLNGETYVLRYWHSLERFAGQGADEQEAIARAPMPGAVISTLVREGVQVVRGQSLLVIESMKMETTISASCDGVVQTLHVEVGQTFDRDHPLVTIERRAEAA